MGAQYVNVCEVNQSSGSTYVTNWGFPEARPVCASRLLPRLAMARRRTLLRFMSRLAPYRQLFEFAKLAKGRDFFSPVGSGFRQ